MGKGRSEGEKGGGEGEEGGGEGGREEGRGGGCMHMLSALLTL